jgi:hypothetical protein
MGIENHHNVPLSSTNHYVSNTTTSGTQKYNVVAVVVLSACFMGM